MELSIEKASIEELAIEGVHLSSVASGIRYANRQDLVLVELADGSHTAGVFTKNAFCAAPVVVAREHLLACAPRYFLINTGNANAGTGAQGLKDARESCQALASIAGIDEREVLPFSTGVIGEPLPLAKLVDGLPVAHAQLGQHALTSAARGIMTTDTRPKTSARQVEIGGAKVSIAGMAKGAGMIKPNMATMLAYVFTDAALSKATLESLLKSQVNKSFNRITVDGDTSTNDSCLLSATWRSAALVENESGECDPLFEKALSEVFQELAMEVIRDAEGATKFVTVRVSGAASVEECLAVAYTVAESPLVKTALFASDPNWGRILAAIGRAGVGGLVIEEVTIRLGDTLIVEGGARAASYTEEAGQREMDKQDILIAIDLQRGSVCETIYTSDLSHDYVSINADYRS